MFYHALFYHYYLYGLTLTLTAEGQVYGTTMMTISMEAGLTHNNNKEMTGLGSKQKQRL